MLSYSARGFHFSCGLAGVARCPTLTLSNPNVCNERGWIRLADARYEVRDTQYLAGLLADEGLVIPNKVGVTGASYGGGQSMILAALKNRVMLPDGTLVPWKSPGGLDMAIAAAAPLIPWSDLAYALTPNGRTLDYRDLNPYGTRGGVAEAVVRERVALQRSASRPASTRRPASIPTPTSRRGTRASTPASRTTTIRMLEDIVDEITTPPLGLLHRRLDRAGAALHLQRVDRRPLPRRRGAALLAEDAAPSTRAPRSRCMFADDFGHPRASLAGDMATRGGARRRSSSRAI